MAEAPVVLANSRGGVSSSRYGTSISRVNVEILALVTRMLWCMIGAMTADTEGCTLVDTVLRPDHSGKYGRYVGEIL